MEQINARVVDRFWGTFRNIQSFGPNKPYALRVEGDMCHRADLEWYEAEGKEEYIRKASVWVEFHPKERPVFIKDDIGIRFTNTTEHIFDTKIIATPGTVGVDSASGKDRTTIVPVPRKNVNHPAIQDMFAGKYPSFSKKKPTRLNLPDSLRALLSGRDETAPSEKPVLLWWQVEEEKKKQQQKEIIDLRNSIRFWHGM